MKKIIFAIFTTLLLTSCGGVQDTEETQTGNLDQTGILEAPVATKIPVETPKIETATGGTTTIKPKSSTQDLINQQDPTPTPQDTTQNQEPDLNAASEEKMVNEFESEIEDLLKLLETGN